jgi:hypothetical protein
MFGRNFYRKSVTKGGSSDNRVITTAAATSLGLQFIVPKDTTTTIQPRTIKISNYYIFRTLLHSNNGSAI